MDRTQAAVEKTRDFYAKKQNAPILQKEFGFYGLDRWIAEGHISEGEDLDRLFGFDADGIVYLGGLGWCEAAFCPAFEEEILEDRGAYELVRDHAGRHVLYFKGRRHGFMPEYVTHPVTCRDSWERDVKWRLDPGSEDRFAGPDGAAERAAEVLSKGGMVGQNVVGGYMYLRSLAGPEGILYMLYDDPELVHDMMRAWFELADAVTARRQKEFTLDELFLAEDICYKNGPLISPGMIREFLFPYYQQLISNIKKRQPDPERKLHIQIDTDGDCRPLIPVYSELGMDYMSPFEAASGCDAAEIRKRFPELLMRGGIDKRILASGRGAIEREVERIMPFMKEQGGFIPMCDHGVPEEVAFEDYMYYRGLMRAF